MTGNPFTHIPPATATAPADHFRLCFCATVLRLLEQVTLSFGTRESVIEQFPFLAGYEEELGEVGGEAARSSEAWREAMLNWEAMNPSHLPLRALREAARLDHSALTLFMCAGLLEEDARFGLVFETLQGTPGQHRPTLGLLNAWWRDENGWTEARARLLRLLELGLARVVNPDAPRLEWNLEAPGTLWDALRGETNATPAPWARFRSPGELARPDDLILSDELQRQLDILPDLLTSGDVQVLVVRGANHNGRRTLLGAVARALGRGTLEMARFDKADDERWRLAGPLATALQAMPVVVYDLAPEETTHIPRLTAYDGPIGIVLGRQGGISGDGAERALTLALEMPDAGARRRHWQRACGEDGLVGALAIGERFRLTSGNIHRAARLAQSYAALANRSAVTLADVQQGTRALNRQALDTLAARINTSGDWGELAVSAETRRELESLERRCRHREHLRDAVGGTLAAQLSPGVRALFSGPSGTGKTFAARLLAAALQMDLYRLDLSAVVNKYIGETEKNLNQLFARAEELDVILLLDEGDALLAQRTSVQSSNDRYANLETNFLLQRLETFEGILIVTTNAGERIDSAFQRRMDVVIPFRPPEAEERWFIWQLHLPPSHAVPPAYIEEVAQRCALNGGQIRNAALHAALLALDDGHAVDMQHLEAAIQREYRKAGALCPLRRTNGAGAH